ncbi:MAG: glutamate 5-kinase [Clostridiales Family XIII bacterium]|jgi:glutamate 5-kinase|nr:glutamate 5-kinase [Clostridiales Family XIII bacterium]
MCKVNEILNSSRKIVLKIGSNVLAGADGNMDMAVVEDIAAQVSGLRDRGKQIVIVSSGAEVSGVSAVGVWSRHGDINYKQAMCAIGQVELMMAYKRCFAKYGVIVAQLLLTRANFRDPNTTLHIRNTLFTLLDEGVVPIINENDSVSVFELGISDNDILAALTANLWSADLLILMSDIDGVYDKSPKEHDDARLIGEVTDTNALRGSIDIAGKSSFGSGGMESKFDAAESVAEHGAALLLVGGKSPGILTRIADGEQAGTIFIPDGK